MKTLLTALLLVVTLVSGVCAADAPAAAAAPGPQPIAGKAIEVLHSGGYTYVQVEDRDGFRDWVAVPEMILAVGDEVEFEAGMQMGEFTSKAMNRTFPRIIFSNGPTGKYNEKRKASAHKGVDMSGQAPSPKKQGKVVDGLKVEKATGLNAYSIAELTAQSASLKDVKIAVRGQVIKVSSNIMGRNWVHLSDGTGGPDAKLVVTTKDAPSLGDIVTAVGPLHLDVDFGGGYQYAIIMEDASVK